MFDLDLNFIRSISSHSHKSGELFAPYDVKFDIAGNMYVAGFSSKRITVMDTCSRFLQLFDQEEKGKLRRSSALHIVDKYVYVSDVISNCICHQIWEVWS